MAKEKKGGKGTDTPKPESKAPIALLRVEQDTQPKPINSDQKADRLAAAGACFDEADVLEREYLLLTSQATEKKKSAAAKRGEGRQIVHDANSGVMQEPFAKIVERHPLHPYEMISWKVPDGVVPADILDLGGDFTGQPHIDRRMAQGCIEIETRAMKPEELEVAKRADWEKSNPGLPFPDVAGQKAIEKLHEIVTPGAGGDVLPFARPAPVAPDESAVIEEMGEPTAAVEDGPLYTARNADGWPLCPGCGADELHSPAIPRTESTIIHCNSCGWLPPFDPIPSRHLAPVPDDVDEEPADETDAYEALPTSDDTRTEDLFAAAGDDATEDDAPPADDAESEQPAAAAGDTEEHAGDAFCEAKRRKLTGEEKIATKAKCDACGKVVKVRPVSEAGVWVATLGRHKTQAK